MSRIKRPSGSGNGTKLDRVKMKEDGTIEYGMLSLRQLERERAHLVAISKVESLTSKVHRELGHTLRHVEDLIDRKKRGVETVED